jgi:hypothetical protein
MISENTWKKIWLLFGVFFILISITMLIGGPVLASITGTEPFSDRARAMISFLWVWMLIYNGIGSFLLAFAALQIMYIAVGYFELVPSEILWAVLPLIWAVLCFVHILGRRRKQTPRTG